MERRLCEAAKGVMNVVRRHSRCDTIDINCWQGNPSVCLRRKERRPMKVEIAKKVRGAIKLRFKNGPTLCFGCCRGAMAVSGRQSLRMGRRCVAS
jgi:hypothetical protein